jgi:hypothetical protein
VHTKFCLEKLEGRYQLGDLNVDGSIILQEVLGRADHLLHFEMTWTPQKMKKLGGWENTSPLIAIS